MRKTITTILSVAFIPSVLADEGYGMMGYGMMHTTKYGIGLLYGPLSFVFASLIFSIIFWGTYVLLVKSQENKKKK